MDAARIQPPIERQLALLGYELLCLEQDGGRTNPVLRLYLDHTDGRPVTLDDCTDVTEALVAWLDVEHPKLREEVSLEVSSPGLERPLVKPAHFGRFQGRLCRVQTLRPLNGQKRFKGWIHAVSDETVSLEEDGVLKAIPFEAIQKARLAPFDEPHAPPARLARASGTDAPTDPTPNPDPRARA